MYERIAMEGGDRVAVMRLNHPQTLNAIGLEMVEEMIDAVAGLARVDGPARCLLITGTGRGFSAGANLTDGRIGTPDGKLQAGAALKTHYNPLLCALRDLRMPIVTAVNGVAAGVGMSLALMGDVVCAARSAYFMQAFARIGLVPDGGSTFLLPRRVGWARAMELSMLAERLPAEKALEWGLINRVFDDEQLLDGALELATRLANGPRSLTLIRKLYWASADNSYEQQLDLEAEIQNQAGESQDFREGVTAFIEKREARFSGR